MRVRVFENTLIAIAQSYHHFFMKAQCILNFNSHKVLALLPCWYLQNKFSSSICTTPDLSFDDTYFYHHIVM